MLASILLFLGGLGGSEVILILAVLLLFFGAKRIPEIARGLGRGIREFKDATNDIKRQIEEGESDTDRQPTVRRPNSEPVKDNA
ncbi:twin-arginine translocase TatA/TatE family subunit [Nostoc sp. NIES-2111]